MLYFRFFRFLMVGLANTLVGLLVIYACKWLFDMGDIKANIVGYAIGMLLGFILNRRWTFDHSGEVVPAFIRYIVVLTCAYLFNLMTVLYAINDLELDSYLAQALGVAPYTVISYLGSHFFAFQKFPHEAN